MCSCYQSSPDLRARTLSVGSSSCSIRLVCTIHASASDLSRNPGIRLHLPLRLFISTLNKCPFCGITRYAMPIMSGTMARGHRLCTADEITHHNGPFMLAYYPLLTAYMAGQSHAKPRNADLHRDDCPVPKGQEPDASDRTASVRLEPRKRKE